MSPTTCSNVKINTTCQGLIKLENNIILHYMIIELQRQYHHQGYDNQLTSS